MSVPTILAFIFYIIGMIAIGVWSYRKTSTIDDYVLGGRSLNGWVTALSAHWRKIFIKRYFGKMLLKKSWYG